MEAANGKLYGMTGVGDFGISPGWIYEYDYATNTYTKKVDFTDPDGRDPQGSLIAATNGKLYGMTTNGGTNNKGVIFEYDPATNTYTKKFDFGGSNGEWPLGSLMQASNGKLYGMTSEGGANSEGTFFEYNYATNTFVKKLDFNGANGSSPTGNSLIEIMNVTSVSEATNEMRFSVHPNPSSGIFTVNYSPSAKGKISLSVTNQLGEVVYADSNKDLPGDYVTTIDFSKYAKGIYFLELVSGEERSVKKIIVQ